MPDFVDAALLSEASVTGVLDGATDDDAFPDPEADHAYIDAAWRHSSGAFHPRPGVAPTPRVRGPSSPFGCAGCHVPDVPMRR